MNPLQAIHASEEFFHNYQQFIAEHARSKLEIFTQSHDWQSKYRVIMQLGKLQPALDAAQKTEQHLVAGCESAAWLLLGNTADAVVFDSDARVVKGIIALVLAMHLQQGGDVIAIWQQLGLQAELSPSRNNGVFAVLQKLQSHQGA